MDFKPEKYEQEPNESSPLAQSRSWIVVAVCASLLTTAVALGYGVHQQSVVGQLTSQNQEMTSAMNEMYSQVDTLNAKLNDVSTQAAAAAAALQKRGERNYFEFDIKKSRSFQREGPLSLSLRKADAKNKSYDIAMVVDDNQLTKKKINLYEPVWIHRTDDPQPVQIVVNKIGKDNIHGYVSAPKYRNSELNPSLQNVSEKQTNPDWNTNPDETTPYRPQ